MSMHPAICSISDDGFARGIRMINPESSLRPCLRHGGLDRYYIVIEHSWVRRYPSSDRQKPVRVSDDPAAADTEDD